MSDQEKLPEIDPNSVENFPLDNPKAKIVRDRGRIRVVERDYYWDKEKKRGLEKRRYLSMKQPKRGAPPRSIQILRAAKRVCCPLS